MVLFRAFCTVLRSNVPTFCRNALFPTPWRQNWCGWILNWWAGWKMCWLCRKFRADLAIHCYKTVGKEAELPQSQWELKIPETNLLKSLPVGYMKPVCPLGHTFSTTLVQYTPEPIQSLWRRKQYVHLKHQNILSPHHVKIQITITQTTTMKTWKLIKWKMSLCMWDKTHTQK